MRPLAVLIGIIMGSAFALFAGLALTWITLLFIPKDQAAELFGEQNTLVLAIAVFASVSLVSGVSFYGQLRERRWRLAAHAAMTASLGAAVWLYWPKK
jgi:hypothetical protein